MLKTQGLALCLKQVVYVKKKKKKITIPKHGDFSYFHQFNTGGKVQAFAR